MFNSDVVSVKQKIEAKFNEFQENTNASLYTRAKDNIISGIFLRHFFFLSMPILFVGVISGLFIFSTIFNDAVGLVIASLGITGYVLAMIPPLKLENKIKNPYE